MSMSFDAYMLHMQQIMQPMRDELTRIGFAELRTPEEVEQFMESAEGTTLVVVNSVCGCAGGLARPAVALALQNEVKPQHLVTVFAGQDKEATAKMREYFTGYAPSSPSFALLKGKQVVHFVPREQIENSTIEAIAANLVNAFNTYCEKQ